MRDNKIVTGLKKEIEEKKKEGFQSISAFTIDHSQTESDLETIKNNLEKEENKLPQEKFDGKIAALEELLDETPASTRHNKIVNS